VTGEAHPPDHPHQPSNVIFGLFPPLAGRIKKQDKRARYAARAREDLSAWLPTVAVPPPPQQRSA
jgi:methylenetetrahydrofolate--tRNA-(uracil-5-)-methyltransferase